MSGAEFASVTFRAPVEETERMRTIAKEQGCLISDVYRAAVANYHPEITLDANDAVHVVVMLREDVRSNAAAIERTATMLEGAKDEKSRSLFQSHLDLLEEEQTAEMARLERLTRFFDDLNRLKLGTYGDPQNDTNKK